MNIFFLHLDPKKCAQMHLDKHVVKMILESAQLLCTVHHFINEENKKRDSNYISKYLPKYKPTHKNHPSAIWSRTSLSNYKWLIQLAKELCTEYTYRYGKIHSTQNIILDLEKNLPDIPDIGFTTPLLAMPNEYKDKDPVESYRHYYFFDKSHMHFWKKRDVPEWITEMRNIFE